MAIATAHEPAPPAVSRLTDAARLRALRSTDLLKGHSDVLDRLARTASKLLGVPISLVNLIDDQRVHFAGMSGLAGAVGKARSLPLSSALCDLVVESPQPLMIEDIRTHAAFGDRPALSDLGLRSYAGVPLTTREGMTLGTFCALDHAPRVWTADQMEVLQDLAAAAVSELELRIGLHERRSREQRFTAFMDHSPVVAALVNGLGTIEYINAMFEWHFSLEPSKVIGHRLEHLTMPLAKIMMRCTAEVLRDGGNVERTEILTSPNGDERQWLLYAFPIEGEGERLVGMVAVDFTDRRRLERQLQQAQKLESIGQLAAGIAHEINTPAQYVSDNVRFLLDSFESLRWVLTPDRSWAHEAHAQGGGAFGRELEARLPVDTAEFLHEEIPRALEQSLEGLDRIASIVRSIKEFSHPGGKEAVLVDINRTLSLALKMAHNEWKYVADGETDFESALPLISCFPGELNQVFLNIVVNAAHAMKETGRHGLLRVVTRLDGDFVRILISDTGDGIPVAIRGKVFDPFFTTKAVGSGTGQGLAIAHSVVVEKHGGTIRFDCPEGKGTTFEIRLPLVPHGSIPGLPETHRAA